MAWIREQVHKEIKENDLNQVIFVDPFSETSKKAKRNLIIASFIALMISILKLEITGFLGIQASQLKLGNVLAQGLACAVVIYLFMVFIFNAFVDYSAWQFKRERQQTKPYLELIEIIDYHFGIVPVKIKNAIDSIGKISPDQEMNDDKVISKDLSSGVGQLNAINKHMKEFVEEAQPLLESWKATIKKMNRLNWRVRVRLIGLWELDILFPLVLSSLAIAKTYQGLKLVIEKLVN